MESPLICEIDSQITYLQQITRITESLKEKCIKLEKDKNEALTKCEALKVKLERLNNKKCINCSFLTNELRKEKKEKEKLKKYEKAKLLKTIARTLASLDDGNSNHVNQLLTELNCGKLSENQERKDSWAISLIEDSDSSEGEDESKILVNETMIDDEDKGASCAFKGHPIIIPETEAMEYSPKKTAPQKVFKDIMFPKLKNKNSNHLKENVVPPENKDVIEQASKKLRLSPILSKVSPPRDMMRANHSARSPSVLSELIEAAGGSTPSSSCQEEKEVAWKMKPSVLIEPASTSAAGGKKLKQMTLSLARTEKKHDISLSDNFRGGVAKHSDEDDIIQPSPEPNAKKTYVKRTTVSGTLEDPDMTVFNPPVTSTCLPVPGDSSFDRRTTVSGTLEDPDMTVFNPPVTSTCLPVPGDSSFDRLPEIQKSPEYKYRRATVRKRGERMRLPGQDCDQCAKYYEAAGLDQNQEVRARLDQCSRHRDKYQLRANTPPGFWDPVLPTTPEDSQDH